ncbi:MAG TPA: cobalamin-independent methionine synthase II family protein [Chloroflexota bacterium]|nr:cobalamin-independent methionine synthase II family protein [Chloroflexota bacterium]
MNRSTDHILVSHAGNLPRPESLAKSLQSGGRDEFVRQLPAAVAEVVKRQAAIGIDVVNDGELSKVGGFSNYASERLGGLEQRTSDVPAMNVSARDRLDFPGFYAAGKGGFGSGGTARIPGTRPRDEAMFCTGPVSYIGQANVEADIANFRAALQGLNVEAYMPAIAPGTIEHWLHNEHYPSEEAFLLAIAEAMHREYKAITDAGFILQIDDPDLPDAWQVYPDMDLADYRRYAQVRVDALNHALRGIPEERVRLHVCWGSGHGPHTHDVPLRDIVDIVLKVKAECYSIEASNPRHDHEWRVWQEVKLPDGKTLMPGVVGHVSDVVEHPRLVADRLVRYAGIVGRENVLAGTDCGIGNRVGHPEIAWAKLEALAKGAQLATEELWH